MHTSPAQAPGTGDSGGMNVALLATAHELAARGIAVDLVTRAAGPATVTEIEPGVEVHELSAGPASPVPKAELPGLVDDVRRTRWPSWPAGRVTATSSSTRTTG